MARRPATLALGALALALALPAPAAAIDGPVVIRLFEAPRSEQLVDVGATGPSPGDVSVETNRLLNARPQFGRNFRERVGQDVFRFTFLTSSLVEASGTAFLPNGRVTFVGVFNLRVRTEALTVIGGTGAYTNARGTAAVDRVRGAFNGTRLVLRLFPAGQG